MSDDMNDEEIIAAVARNRRDRLRLLSLYVGAWCVAGCVSGLLTDFHRRAAPLDWWIFAGGNALALVGLVTLDRILRLPAGFHSPRAVRLRIDQLQRDRVRLLWGSGLCLLGGAPNMLLASDHLIERHSTTADLFRWLSSIGLFAVMAGMVMTLMGFGYAKAFRFAIDDELSRSLRAKATRSGFLTSLVGGSGAFLAGLVQPRLAVLALPLVIMGSVAVAAAHFVILDRRAGG